MHSIDDIVQLQHDLVSSRSNCSMLSMAEENNPPPSITGVYSWRSVKEGAYIETEGDNTRMPDIQLENNNYIASIKRKSNADFETYSPSTAESDTRRYEEDVIQTCNIM